MTSVGRTHLQILLRSSAFRLRLSIIDAHGVACLRKICNVTWPILHSHELCQLNLRSDVELMALPTVVSEPIHTNLLNAYTVLTSFRYSAIHQVCMHAWQRSIVVLLVPFDRTNYVDARKGGS
jgi:hypothetical protein